LVAKRFGVFSPAEWRERSTRSRRSLLARSALSAIRQEKSKEVLNSQLEASEPGLRSWRESSTSISASERRRRNSGGGRLLLRKAATRGVVPPPSELRKAASLELCAYSISSISKLVISSGGGGGIVIARENGVSPLRVIFSESTLPDDNRHSTAIVFQDLMEICKGRSPLGSSSSRCEALRLTKWRMNPRSGSPMVPLCLLQRRCTGLSPALFLTEKMAAPPAS